MNPRKHLADIGIVASGKSHCGIGQFHCRRWLPQNAGLYQYRGRRIGKLECDFIMRRKHSEYSYIQVAITIMNNVDTENREFKPLESIRDNYPKYVMTRNDMIQRRNGIVHANIGPFMKDGKSF